jgi:SAM-dependent methyltransferase
VAIRWAQEKNALHQVNIRYVHGDLSHPDFQLSGHFDVIVDGNCLHCILDEGRAIFLSTVRAALSENGIFFVSSLCSQDSQTHIMLRDGKPYRHIPPSDSLEIEVRQARFEVLDRHLHRHEQRKYDHINLFLRNTRNSAVARHDNSNRSCGYIYDAYGFS